MNITVLCGGVGAARLLCGFNSIVDSDSLNVKAIVNTGDDDEMYGFYVCPDVDSILYHLADIHDDKRGWGRKNETFRFVETLKELGQNAWFNLGDQDLALNSIRTRLLEEGESLRSVTKHLCEVLAITNMEIIPMCEEKVRTRITTSDDREISLQEYFVKERCVPEIKSIDYLNAPDQPDDILKDAIMNADKIIIAPSNPFLSLNPIFSIGNVREILSEQKDKVVAVSPIVSGQAIKGPLAQIMKNYEMEVSPISIAKIYKDIASTIVIDNQDSHLANEISSLGITPVVFDTIMNTNTKRKDLAKKLVEV